MTLSEPYPGYPLSPEKRRLISKAEKQLAKLDTTGRFNDQQLLNLATNHLPEVALPLIILELQQRLQVGKG